MKIDKIAVLTSGGDAQGMNSVINILVRIASLRNIKIFGVLNGYKGLYNDEIIELDNSMVENISSLGGTILKTARFEEFKNERVVEKSAKNLKNREIDVLIVIGGDGSYKGARALRNFGINVLLIPGTIDNDLRYTHKCLGFDTAVNNACKYIENVKQTMSSLNRGVVFEVMGRNCGDIALYSAVSTACDILAIPEKPITEEELIEKVNYCVKNKNKAPTIVIAEKMFDVREIASSLTKKTGVDFRYSIVGYIQRGGSPSVEDKALAMQYAVRAMELVEDGIFNRAIGMRNNKVFDEDIDTALNAEYDFNYDLLNLFYLLNYKKD